MALLSCGRWALRQETSSSICLLLARVYQYQNGRSMYLRLSALVAADFSQCLLVASGHVTMPLSEETNKVDLVCLTAVDCLIVIVTVDRVESVVIGELLLGDCLLGLQAKDSIDVLFLLFFCKLPP